MSLHPLRREARRERRRYRSRVIVAVGLAGAGLLTLFLRVGYLQVVQYEHYTTLSGENRLRVRTIPPARGLVRDRNGVVLARNFSVFSLEIVPEQTRGVDRTLALLGEILDIEEEEGKFRQQMRRLPGFESIPLKTRLDEREVAVFSVNRHRFPGVDIHSRLVREYPFGEALAHVVGYVGRIDPVERSRLRDDPHYRATRYIGKTGVERSWERTLHGFAGVEQVEVDARGRVVRTIRSTAPVQGAEVTIGLDLGLQLRAQAALSGQVGAIVAVDPRDGAVLAFASAPSFDPNPLVHGIDRKSYAALSRAPDRPLFNRALHGQYSPGSVAKIFLAFAGLDQSLDRTLGRVRCDGRYRLPDTTYEYRDWKAGGHGRVGLERGLAESCDVYFYELAYRLGIARIHDYLTRFGFGQPTGVDLPREARGPGPVARVEARRPRPTLDGRGDDHLRHRPGVPAGHAPPARERDRRGGPARGPAAAPGRDPGRAERGGGGAPGGAPASGGRGRGRALGARHRRDGAGGAREVRHRTADRRGDRVPDRGEDRDLPGRAPGDPDLARRARVDPLGAA